MFKRLQRLGFFITLTTFPKHKLMNVMCTAGRSKESGRLSSMELHLDVQNRLFVLLNVQILITSAMFSTSLAFTQWEVQRIYNFYMIRCVIRFPLKINSSKGSENDTDCSFLLFVLYKSQFGSLCMINKFLLKCFL